MKWAPNDCKSGDMIRIHLGSVHHYGIFVSEDEVIQFGYPPLPEFKDKNQNITVGAVSIDEFSSGKIVEVAVLDRKEKKRRFPPEKTVEIARSKIGTGGYNILHNNCEHFCYECVFGVKKSTQEEYIRSMWQSMLFKDGKDNSQD